MSFFAVFEKYTQRHALSLIRYGVT